MGTAGWRRRDCESDRDGADGRGAAGWAPAADVTTLTDGKRGRCGGDRDDDDGRGVMVLTAEEWPDGAGVRCMWWRRWR